MPDSAKYYIIQRDALPEVFIKVVQAKQLLDSNKVGTVQEAVDLVGISRSSFYKYKDTISPFFEGNRGRTITVALKLDDEPGILSQILNVVAGLKANILTIHQTIPINGIADITMSIEILPHTESLEQIVERLETENGVHHIKILARE